MLLRDIRTQPDNPQNPNNKLKAAESYLLKGSWLQTENSSQWWHCCFIFWKWQWREMGRAGEKGMTCSRGPMLDSNPGCCNRDSALMPGTCSSKWATAAPSNERFCQWGLKVCAFSLDTVRAWCVCREYLKNVVIALFMVLSCWIYIHVISCIWHRSCGFPRLW